MGRARKIPEDNKYFKYHNENPKGRHTGDCVVRAIALATDQSWEKVIRDLTDVAITSGYSPLCRENYESYLKHKYSWYKQKQLKQFDGTKYTGKDFILYLENHPDTFKHNDAVIAHIGSHHITTFKREPGGHWRCWDIWDPTDFCVGNYFMFV